MQAGKLNRQITIERRAAGDDEIGQPVETWVEVCKPWADIRFISGLQAIRGDADTSTAKASIRVRYRTDLDAGMRVVAGRLTFNIVAVLPDEARREYVDLACEVNT